MSLWIQSHTALIFLASKAIWVRRTNQTFSLDQAGKLLIKGSLLDRFLACMKPASITQRPLRAGVFFVETLSENLI